VETYPTRFTRLLVSGAEICPTTQRRHIHVYVEFEYQKAMSQLDRLLRFTGLPKPFINAATRSDYSRIRADYIKTETKEDLDRLVNIEWPIVLDTEQDSEAEMERPTKKLKLLDHELRSLVESNNIEEIKRRDYRLYLRMRSSIEAEAGKHRVKTPDEEKEHLWIVGYTGQGKTAIVHKLWPDAYQWDLCNPNPEEYNNESVVVLDDMDNKRFRLLTSGKLKNLTNAAGTRCKVNYGSVFMKATIIVTSQYSLKDCFKYKGKARFQTNPDFATEEPDIEDDPDYQAIARRFKEVDAVSFIRDECKLQLMSKEEIKTLTPEQRSSYEIFKPYVGSEYSEQNYNPGTHDLSDTTASEAAPIDEHTKEEKCTDSNCKKRGFFIGKGIHIHYK
jgi:hypothetical protein